MNKYGSNAEEKMHNVMKEFEDGTLKMGCSGKRVSNRKQAVTIGIQKLVSLERKYHMKIQK